MLENEFPGYPQTPRVGRPPRLRVRGSAPEGAVDGSRGFEPGARGGLVLILALRFLSNGKRRLILFLPLVDRCLKC